MNNVSFKVVLNMPNLPNGEAVQIAGLGLFLNGDTRVISEQEEMTWRNYHGQLGDDNVFVPGPTLVQASKTMPGVTVTRVSAEPTEPPTLEAQAPAPAEEVAEASLADEVSAGAVTDTEGSGE